MTHQEYVGRRKYENLDWLRGISILMVIFHHVPNVGPDNLLSVLRANGRYGVSLFFTISGFLICSLLLMERERHGTIDIKAFYMRRTLRLFPLYYAVLAMYCLQIFVFHQYSSENQILFATDWSMIFSSSAI